jgi:hypothetical protein
MRPGVFVPTRAMGCAECMILDSGSGWNTITRGPGILKYHVSNRFELLSGPEKRNLSEKRKLNICTIQYYNYISCSRIIIFIHSPSQTRTNTLGASASGRSPHLPGRPSRR